MRLFVYGTLRPGGRYWDHLAPWVSGVGATGVLTGHLLFAGPAYPLATPAADRRGSSSGMAEASAGESIGELVGEVVGEILEIPDSVAGEALAVADRIEGAPELFERVRVADLWVYLATPQTLLEVAAAPVPSGDWFDVELSAREAWEAAMAMPYAGPTCRYGPP